MSEETSDPVQLRLATVADSEGLANLRFEWDQPDSRPSLGLREDFTTRFEQWWTAAQPWCACSIAEVGNQLVGMAWLVLHQRIPNPSQFERTTGDLQSVYVRPNHRHLGVGRGLVKLLLDEGERRGVTRFTVESNESATHFYERQGFTSSPLLMNRDRTH